MEGCVFDIKFSRHITEEAMILLSNHISFFNNLNIMGSLRYCSQVQVYQIIKYMQANHMKHIMDHKFRGFISLEDNLEFNFSN
jgi:hypothetical protein